MINRWLTASQKSLRLYTIIVISVLYTVLQSPWALYFFRYACNTWQNRCARSIRHVYCELLISQEWGCCWLLHYPKRIQFSVAYMRRFINSYQTTVRLLLHINIGAHCMRDICVGARRNRASRTCGWMYAESR